ncbi:unnamed protein product, partial [marine sediment metagenome]
ELYSGTGRVTPDRLVVDERNPNLLVLYGHDGVFAFSCDGGQNWHTPKDPEVGETLVFMTGSRENEGLVFAQSKSRRTYFSFSDGAIWEPYADPLNPRLWTKEVRKIVAETFPYLLPGEKGDVMEGTKNLRALPREQGPIYKSMGWRIMRSDDGGRTWNPACKGLGWFDVSWVEPLPGVPAGVLAMGKRSIANSYDGGENWKIVETGNLRIREVEFTAHTMKPEVVFGLDRNGFVIRSADHGKTWQKVLDANGRAEDVKRILAGTNQKTSHCFVFDRQDPNHVGICTLDGILESVDCGHTWKKMVEFSWPGQRSGIQPYLFVCNSRAITICRKWRSGIFQTRDLGRTWRHLEGPFLGHRIVGLAGRPENPGALCVLTKEAVSPVLWVSGDFGQTWEARALPFHDYEPYSFAQNPVNPDMLAVGIGDSVWLSMDDGKNWRDLGHLPDMERSPITMLAFSPADKRLYAIVLRNGLFWTELPEPVRSKEQVDLQGD